MILLHAGFGEGQSFVWLRGHLCALPRELSCSEISRFAEGTPRTSFRRPIQIDCFTTWTTATACATPRSDYCFWRDRLRQDERDCPSERGRISSKLGTTLDDADGKQTK
jgi:hypothetical protein